MSIVDHLLLLDSLNEIDRLLHFHLLNIPDVLVQQNIVATVELKLVEKAAIWERLALFK